MTGWAGLPGTGSADGGSTGTQVLSVRTLARVEGEGGIAPGIDLVRGQVTFGDEEKRQGKLTPRAVLAGDDHPGGEATARGQPEAQAPFGEACAFALQGGDVAGQPGIPGLAEGSGQAAPDEISGGGQLAEETGQRTTFVLFRRQNFVGHLKLPNIFRSRGLLTESARISKLAE